MIQLYIHTHTFFFIFFSIIVYHSILNIVPCAIHLDLVFYPFHIYWFTSANPKHPIPSPLPSFTTTVFCSSVCGTGIWKELRQLVLEVSSAAATRYSLGLWLPDREGNGTPLQYSCLENPMHGGAWWAAVHGVAKSRTQLSDFTFTFSLSCIGEGNGNPFQCSCLENPRDGGAWWADVYGVTQSWTWLKWLSSSSSMVTWSDPSGSLSGLATDAGCCLAAEVGLSAWVCVYGFTLWYGFL